MEFKERKLIWNDYPLSLYNSQVNSPILTNRSSFNNTLPNRESLTGRAQDPIFISSELRAPEASSIPSTAKPTHYFVDIAGGYDTTGQMSTFMCNSTRAGLESNLSRSEGVEVTQRTAKEAMPPPPRLSSNQKAILYKDESRKRGGGFLFRQQAEGVIATDRNSVYVQGTKIGSNLQEESRPRT